jgi:hypothetical protein
MPRSPTLECAISRADRAGTCRGAIRCWRGLSSKASDNKKHKIAGCTQHLSPAIASTFPFGQSGHDRPGATGRPAAAIAGRGAGDPDAAWRLPWARAPDPRPGAPLARVRLLTRPIPSIECPGSLSGFRGASMGTMPVIRCWRPATRVPGTGARKQPAGGWGRRRPSRCPGRWASAFGLSTVVGLQVPRPPGARITGTVVSAPVGESGPWRVGPAGSPYQHQCATERGPRGEERQHPPRPSRGL